MTDVVLYSDHEQALAALQDKLDVALEVARDLPDMCGEHLPPSIIRKLQQIKCDV